MIGGERAPLESREQFRILEDVRIVQHFPGWTLDYVRSLSWKDRESILAVVEADRTKAKVGK